MIVFHNDHLAPAGFCQLLSEFVSQELHIPVVFTAHGGGGGKWLGRVDHGYGDPCRYHIQLRLDRIHTHVIFHRTDSSLAAGLWRQLLDAALHEFGHVATCPQLDEAIYSEAAYEARDPQGYGDVEALAETWAAQQINRLLDFDPRLVQPGPCLTGYFGARDVQYWSRVARGNHSLISEFRCAQSGAQLTSGHVLSRLGRVGDYALLRKLSDGLGTPYTDAAGRRHILYTWGDLRQLERLLPTPLPKDLLVGE